MALSKTYASQVFLWGYAPYIAFSYFGLPEAITNFYVAHSVELMMGNFALPMLTLIYTDPQSRIRFAVLPLVAAGVACYHITSPRFSVNRTNAAGLDGPHMLLFLTAVDTLVQKQLYLDASGIERSGSTAAERPMSGETKSAVNSLSGPTSSTYAALAWAIHVIFSYRAIGTRRQAKNVPTFGGNKVPSRPSFLLEKGIATLVAFLFVDFVNHQPPPNSETFAARKSKLILSLSDLNGETVLVRIFSTAVFWFMLRIIIGLIYNAVAFIAVATLLTTPEDWPPYFGSVTESFTLRNFWAVFWHSGLRNPLLGAANFFTYHILALPRGTLAARYVNIWLVFGFSGLIHTLSDATAGIPQTENTAYKLFSMQALGVCLEDLMQWMHQTFWTDQEHTEQEKKIEGKGGVEKPFLWQRVMGYLWVAAWLVLSTPSWSYENMRNDGGQLFTFSIVDKFQR